MTMLYTVISRAIHFRMTDAKQALLLRLLVLFVYIAGSHSVSDAWGTLVQSSICIRYWMRWKKRRVRRRCRTGTFTMFARCVPVTCDIFCFYLISYWYTFALFIMYARCACVTFFRLIHYSWCLWVLDVAKVSCDLCARCRSTRTCTQRHVWIRSTCYVLSRKWWKRTVSKPCAKTKMARKWLSSRCASIVHFHSYKYKYFTSCVTYLRIRCIL